MNKKTINVFKYFMDTKLLWSLVIPILLSMVAALVSVRIPLYLKQIIDILVDGKLLNINLLYILSFLTITQLLLQVLSDYLLQRIGIIIVNNLRSKVIHKILGLRSSFFDKSLSGDITSILSNDTTSVYTLTSTTIPKALLSIFEIFVYGFVLIFLSIKLSLVVAIMIPLIYIIYLPLGRFIEKNYSKMQIEIGNLNVFGSFITRSQKYIKINNTQKQEEENGALILNNLKEIGLKKAKLTAFISPLLAALSLSSIIFTILLGFYLISLKQLTTGSLVAYLTLFFQIITPIASLGDCFTEFKGLLGTTERLKNLLDNDDVEDLHEGNEIKNNFIEKLKFENVNFNYPVREKSSDKIFGLKNISFTVEVGKSVAFVGPSGAGKTTIFDLLEFFYSINSGNIYINGSNHHDYSIYSVRENISYVSQSYPLVNGTIYENLLYGLGTPVTTDELLRATKEANFYEVISTMPEGLDTYIGEDGQLLSGGEKQRLALTRAFLKPTSLILLDEVTAALDAENESIIQASIEKIKKNRTVFTIAHRLSTIKNSDKIIFLQKGKITGIGTHNELMENHKLYRKFIQIQFQMNNNNVDKRRSCSIDS